MVDEANRLLFKRKDGKHLIYVPKDPAGDSMFPFKENPSVRAKICFKVADTKLVVEKWEDKTDA